MQSLRNFNPFLPRCAVSDPFSGDPFAPPEPNPQRLKKLYVSLLGLTPDVTRGRGGEWRGDRRGRGRGWRGRRGGYYQGGKQGTPREGVDWRLRDTGGGGDWGKGWGGRARRGGRARQGWEEGSEQQQQTMTPAAVVEEVPPATMKAEEVAAKESRENVGETRQKLVQPVKKEEPVVASSAPTPIGPVVLFPREGPRGEGSRETERGAGQLVPTMSADVAGKEVNWHCWRLGKQVEKVRDSITDLYHRPLHCCRCWNHWH